MGGSRGRMGGMGGPWAGEPRLSLGMGISRGIDLCDVAGEWWSLDESTKLLWSWMRIEGRFWVVRR